MINIPRTYYEWKQVFEILESGENDGEVLEAIYNGTVYWQSGVAERFNNRLIKTINKRMDKASDKMQKGLKRATSEGDIVNLCLAMRKEFEFLYKVINMNALPEDYKESYRDMIDNSVSTLQNSLEESAKKDRTGKLLTIIKNNRVDNVDRGC